MYSVYLLPGPQKVTPHPGGLWTEDSSRVEHTAYNKAEGKQCTTGCFCVGSPKPDLQISLI